MKDYFPNRFPAFTSHDFSVFWLSQFVSNIGSQMQFVAINWHIYVLTNSAFALGLVGLLRFVPILIFSLIGGSVADAHNRKRILFVTQSTLTILSFILAFLTITGAVNVVSIYIITAVSAVALSFDMPARQAFIPGLVDKKHLQNAMSLNSIMFQTGSILGPTAAGFLIAHSGLGIIYNVNAFSFMTVITSLFFIKTSGRVQGIPTKISFSSVLEGLEFVRSKTIIWSTMLLDFFSTFFSSATALIPIFAKDILNVGPMELGLLYAAQSVGAVSAGLLIAHFHQLSRQGLVLLLSVTLYGIGTIIFGLSHVFLISLLGLVIVGAGDSVSTIIRNTIRQLETPDYIRGRMTSINMIFFMGGPQLGDFEAGVLASRIGAPFATVIGGIGTIIAVGFMTVGVPVLRRYDHHVK